MSTFLQTVIIIPIKFNLCLCVAPALEILWHVQPARYQENVNSFCEEILRWCFVLKWIISNENRNCLTTSEKRHIKVSSTVMRENKAICSIVSDNWTKNCYNFNCLEKLKGNNISLMNRECKRHNHDKNVLNIHTCLIYLRYISNIQN